ncbi:MAG: hypothetical protein ACLFSQ_02085 [Candidatus Zixiibacteriota bacterium]
MKRILIPSVILIITSLFAYDTDHIIEKKSIARSSVLQELQESSLEENDWRNKTYAQAFDNATEEKTKPFEGEEFLDSKLAFGLSFLVPGAGEVYAKKPVKGVLFFLAEAGLWTGYYILQSKGIEMREDYEDYHDSHYDVEAYLEWFSAITDSFENIKGTETLPHHGDNWYDVDKNHDYYEMTGKYNWFLIGWKDVPDALFDDPEIREELWNPDLSSEPGPYSNILSQYRDSSQYVSTYMQMRKDANDQFIWAKYMIGGAILNHIVSAFDAAWTAHVHNRERNKSFSEVIDFKTGIAVHEPTGLVNPELKMVINLK